MGVEAQQGFLPAKAKNVIVSPTANRWFNEDQSGTGFLPRLVKSSQETLDREGLNGDTLIIIGDASDPGITDRIRAKLLSSVSVGEGKAPVYVLTKETRRRVAEAVAERTKLRQEIVSAILEEDDYGKQRTHLDTVVGGIVLASGQSIKAVTLDDDIVVPPKYAKVREGSLPIIESLRHRTNSQVIFQHDGVTFPHEIYERRENSGFKPFFEFLGETVGKIRASHPNLRATRTWVDNMHEKLPESVYAGSTQFVVTYPEEEDLPDAHKYMVIAATATKSGMPDYRTVQIAKMFLEDGLPENELNRQSFPFGDKELFAIRECNTNIDSAAFSRLFNEKTTFWPWWFVSDLQISLGNPYKSVPAKYRADNELLPVLFKYIFDRTGEGYLYMAGLSTQVLHKRAQTGYRPNLATHQAPASLVGNIAALEAARMLVFDAHTGIAHVPMVDADYKAPHDHSLRVFEELINLRSICVSKIPGLIVKKDTTRDASERQDLEDKIGRYLEIIDSFEEQLAGLKFADWKKALDQEIRDQLRFYSQVLEALPKVMEASGQLIKEGGYPVVQFISTSQPRVSFPGKPTTIKR